MIKKILLLATIICLSFISFGQVPNYVPTNGLVSWWPFNGNANDESGNSNDGTVHGALATTDRFGSSNSAFLFNGQTVPSSNNTSILEDCYIHVPSYNAFFTNAITISTWVNYNNNNQSPYGGDPLVVKRNSNTIDFDLSISNHKFGLSPIGGGYNLSGFSQLV